MNRKEAVIVSALLVSTFIGSSVAAPAVQQMLILNDPLNVRVVGSPEATVSRCVRDHSLSVVTQPLQEVRDSQELCQQTVDGFQKVRVFGVFSITFQRVSSSGGSRIDLSLEAVAETDGIRVGPLTSMYATVYSLGGIGDTPVADSGRIYFEFDVISPQIILVLRYGAINVSVQTTVSVSTYSTA